MAFVMPLKRARIESSPSPPASSEAMDRRVSEQKALSTYVKINVGGFVFRTSTSVLAREPSRLYDLAKTNFSGLPTDSDGNPFIDRDPCNFRHILNYLRGYQVPQLAEDLIFLADDAEYFGLEQLLRLIGIRQTSHWSFLPGPGISSNGRELTSTSVTALCGTDYFSTGSHSITFKIEKCEMIGVGLVTRDFTPSQSSTLARSSCCCYFNTGEVLNFINDQFTASENRFKDGDSVTVSADFETDDVRVGFTKAGCAACSFNLKAPVPELRFAVFLHGASVVQIVSAAHSLDQR
jgi:hypothetical protein